MVLKPRARRGLALVLILLGAALMLLSPSIGVGLVVFAVGVLLELIGWAIERRGHR